MLIIEPLTEARNCLDKQLFEKSEEQSIQLENAVT
jgi:hypothetical protein